ncbi:MAG: tetratricopeptide repeat protein [Paenibacillus macerans]|uniref:tetratricopeptide repeat protein n=1 Tax=Paenibacillus macerans TaxID=44252 RepID=UPI00242AD330|nr:tetratricopeptide repeat protein [Paenibacillus macerans]MDU5946912.1 tetratricopeptide repeat protein [Paenibacillus macerans]MDU7475283.1 tetratricopeptide repeat protein [Paenibacillus macerans]
MGEREQPPLAKSSPELVAEFIEELDGLYLNFASRCNVALWVELLNGNVLWQPGNQGLLGARVLDYLNEHYFLPEAVWGLLEDAFGLEERFIHDPSGFGERCPKVCEYAFRSSPAATLGYSSLSEADGIDVEAYLHAREDFVTAMLANEPDSAREALERALDIYDRDAEILRLQIEFYRRTGELERALSACNLWVSQFAGDAEVIIVRVSVLLNMGRPDEAREELERIRPARPDDAEVLSLLGRCYLRLEQMGSAREVYDRMLRNNSRDIEAVVGLANRCIHKRAAAVRQGPPKANAAVETRVGQAFAAGVFKEAGHLFMAEKRDCFLHHFAAYIITDCLVLQYGGFLPGIREAGDRSGRTAFGNGEGRAEKRSSRKRGSAEADKRVLYAIVLCLLYLRFIVLLFRSKRYLMYK